MAAPFTLVGVPNFLTQAGKVVQVAATEDGVEFGQKLGVNGSPTFEGLTLLAQFTVECLAVLNNGLLVENDAIFNGTIDACGALNVKDNKITLGNVDTPTELTADGGGIVLLGATNKTLLWLNSLDAWAFNQGLAVQGTMSVGAVAAPTAGASIELKAVDKGLLLNRLTTIQRNALAAAPGMMIYNTTLDDMEFRTPTLWKSMNGALVTGPALATDNAVVRYDGTSGKLAQNSGVVIDDAGNVVIPGDLTVGGTKTQLDTVTLLVEDKNIELGVVATPTDASADGGGITLKGTIDKTITWLNSTGAWTFNQDIDALGNIIKTTGVVTGGFVIGITSVFGGNLLLSGNTLSSANADGDILIIPNGAGGTLIGTGVAPDGTLHVHTGSSGAVTASSAADGIVVEDSTNTGISILTPDASVGRVIFGSPSDPFGAFMAWSFSGSDFAVGPSKIGANFRLTSGQETTNLTLSGGAGSELATFAKDVTINGQIKIIGGTPALDRVLTSDVDGVATWETPLTTFLELTDTPSSFTGQAGKVIQVDAAGVGSEFGQLLRATDSPTFNDLVLTGDLTVQGLTTTLDTTTLLVEDKNIELGNVAVPTDITADGGGITLLAGVDGDKTIKWLNAFNCWAFNQDIDVLGNNIRSAGFISADQFIAFTQLVAGNLRLLGNTLSSTNANGDIALTPNGTGKVVINSTLQISSGSPGLDKVLTSDANGLATWQEDLGTVIAQETFASTNVRFFGELALPTAQGWTDVATGSATIDLQTQLVFEKTKQVVRHNDDFTNGSTTSSISLTSQNWTDINAFGAVYSGTSRLDTTDGAGGFFSGLQANTTENPLATGNRRYGILFADDVGNLKVTEPDAGTTVTFDGTGGNPLILFDEWFSWECVVPVGLGAAQFFINEILTTFAPTFRTNGGGLGTKIIVSSGSTGGANRITYHDNFGVTIFEDAATKTLASATMEADIVQVNIPEGRRDYTIILPDGNPRALGSVFRVVANNLFGKITLENQNPAAPEILYNGLRTLVIDVFAKEIIGGINTVDQGNVYLGFKDEDIDRAESIFAQLSSSVDQIPVDTNPTVIAYNTQDEINGIGHSTSLNPGELEILPGFGGVYFVSPQPQVGKDTGGVKTDLDMFWQIDRGSGFVDEPNSNVKITIKDSDITDVIVSAFTIQLNVGDKIRMMQRVSSSTVGLGLKSTAAETGPPTVPATPSIILSVHRIGGVPA